MSKQTIFISYARNPDEPFAKHLFEDLKQNGFSVWWDRNSMENRGRTFLQEIRDAIAESDRLIAVIGSSALKSQYVQSEWEHALLFSKAILPLLRDGDFNQIPPDFSKFHCIDFRNTRDYSDALAELLRILSEPVAPLAPVITTPSLPPHFIPRSGEIIRLKEKVLADVDKPIVVTYATQKITSIIGMGGVGKSVLAAALARTADVRRSFIDGIIWLSIGPNPDLTSRLKSIGIAFDDDPKNYVDLETAKIHLPQVVADKNCLIVLDDVRDVTSVEPFMNVGPRCRLLITTRDGILATDLGTQEHLLGELSDADALQLLAQWSDKEISLLTQEALSVARECGNLPFALALCGAMARDGQPWPDLVVALQKADLEFMERKFPNYPYTSILKSMKVSIDMLTAENADWTECYYKLVIFPKKAIPESAVLILLLYSNDLKEREVRKILYTLARKSLIKLEGESPNLLISLHDLQHDYLRAVASDISNLHCQLLSGYQQKCNGSWSNGPNDGYYFEHLAHHLVEAGKMEDLRHLLFDFGWIQAKLEATDINSVVRDYHNFFQEDTALLQVAGAVRLSAHVISYDKSQLQSQLYGRLVQNKSAEIKKLLREIILSGRDIWLKPIIPNLIQPVGPLVQTLTGHEGAVRSIAISHNEKYIISASDDKTIRIWDIQSRLPIGILKGHSEGIDSVFSIPGSNRVISISGGRDDHTIRVWDLDSQSELFCIPGDKMKDLFKDITVSPDGRYAFTISSFSEFIKMWDLTNGKLVKVFRAHDTMMGRNIAVSPDGKKLIISTWQDYKIKVWRLDDLQLLCAFDKHKGYIASLFISNDGKYVVSASNHMGPNDDDPHGLWVHHRTIKKWELETAKEVLCVEYTQPKWGDTLEENKNEAYAINAIAPLPNDVNSMISASNSGPLQIWDLQGKTDLITLKGHEQSVYDVTVIKNRNLAVSCSQDGTLKMWDLSRVKEAQSYFGHKVDVTCITLSSDARLAITFSWDGDMKVWDLEKCKEQKSLQVYKGLLKCISIFPDGNRGIAALSDKSLRIWNIYTGKELRRIKLNSYSPPDFKSIKVSPDSNYAIGTYDEEGVDEGGASRSRGVYIVDLNKDDFVKPEILINDDGSYSGNRVSYYGKPLDFTSDGNYVIAADDWISEQYIWNFKNPRICYDIKFPIIKGPINSIVPVPNSNHILTCSGPNDIKVWDIENKKVIRDIALATDGCQAVAISASGERAVSADNLNQVNLWNFRTEEILARFSAESNITACSITPDGKTIIAGEESGRIHILKVEEKVKQHITLRCSSYEDL